VEWYGKRKRVQDEVSGARWNDKGKEILRRVSLPRVWEKRGRGLGRDWMAASQGAADASKVELDCTKSLRGVVRGGLFVGCALVRIQSHSILAQEFESDQP
jgi:hypothetical protein